jgi:hypothetical protein
MNLADMLTAKPKKKQGFASLTPERRSEIASMGGRTSQRRGTAHRWTPEEASAASKMRRRKT